MIPWQTMIDEHGPAVWRTAYRLVGNRSDADDCMQEAFVAAVQAQRRGEVKHWPALLQRIAVSRAIDCLRRRRRDVLRGADPIALHHLASAEQAGPATAASNGELTAHLRRALTRLPQRQAQVVCLRYLSQLSYEEISQQLRISTNHVGVILSRAREKLRDMLESEGVDHG